MKLRILLIGLAALLLAQPGFADLVKYSISGDQSTQFPTDGTVLRPGTQSGKAFIEDDNGGGTPTLEKLVSRNIFLDIVGGTTTTGIPGTTVVLNSLTTAQPSPDQAGSGTTSTTISWGSLTGWTQTGRLICITNCPGGCPTGVSSCVPFVGFEGTGPPAPLKSTSFTLDPFTFSGGGASFSSPSTEFVNLSGGAVTAAIQIGGAFEGDVPAVPLAALGGLGAGLVYLGTRALRRNKKD